jgi:hypothetical protein
VAGGKVTDAGEGMVANPNTPPIVAQPGQAIPQGPELHQVQAGDLITAQFINDVVLAVQNLQERVADLEALLDDTSDTSAPTI